MKKRNNIIAEIQRIHKTSRLIRKLETKPLQNDPNSGPSTMESIPLVTDTREETNGNNISTKICDESKK